MTLLLRKMTREEAKLTQGSEQIVQLVLAPRIKDKVIKTKLVATSPLCCAYLACSYAWWISLDSWENEQSHFEVTNHSGCIRKSIRSEPVLVDDDDDDLYN